MRPLFLFCRASGASIKYLYDKTFEMNQILASFMSQDAAHGALPTLRAATETDAAQGSYYAPNRMFGLKGDPILVSVPRLAQDEEVAMRLWEVSLRLTGVSFAGLG